MSFLPSLPQSLILEYAKIYNNFIRQFIQNDFYPPLNKMDPQIIALFHFSPFGWIQTQKTNAHKQKPIPYDPVGDTFLSMKSQTNGQSVYFSLVAKQLDITALHIPQLVAILSNKRSFSYTPSKLIKGQGIPILGGPEAKWRNLALFALQLLRFHFRADELFLYRSQIIPCLTKLLLLPCHPTILWHDLILVILQQLPCLQLFQESTQLLQDEIPAFPQMFPGIYYIDHRCYLIEVFKNMIQPSFPVTWKWYSIVRDMLVRFVDEKTHGIFQESNQVENHEILYSSDVLRSCIEFFAVIGDQDNVCKLKPLWIALQSCISCPRSSTSRNLSKSSVDSSKTQTNDFEPINNTSFDSASLSHEISLSFGLLLAFCRSRYSAFRVAAESEEQVWTISYPEKIRESLNQYLLKAKNQEQLISDFQNDFLNEIPPSQSFNQLKSLNQPPPLKKIRK